MCWYSAIQGPYVVEDPPLPSPPPRGRGDKKHSDRASLTPSPPWGEGRGEGELCTGTAQKSAEHLDAGLSLHDQFQTYTQSIRTGSTAA